MNPVSIPGRPPALRRGGWSSRLQLDVAHIQSWLGPSSRLRLALTVLYDRTRSGTIKVQAYNGSLVQHESIFCPPVSTHQVHPSSALYQTMGSILAVTRTASGVPPPPRHWILNGERDSPNYTVSLAQNVVLFTHRILCLVAFGEPSIRPIWERSHCGDITDWEETRSSLRERIQHMNIIVSSFGFQRGGTLLYSRRAVYFSPRSRPSAAPIHLQIPSSFHTRKKVPRVSYS